MNIPEVDDFN